MGWTSYRATEYKKGKIDRVAEVKKYFADKKDVLKISAVGSTVYLAVKNNDTSVSAMVFLTSISEKEYFNFAYKEMDESCGPYKYDCPASILKLLTPTDSEYANEWRKECWNNIEKKKMKKKNPNSLSNLSIGSKIKINDFKGNSVVLEKVDYPRYKNPIWIDYSKYVKYKPKDIERLGYEVIYSPEK